MPWEIFIENREVIDSSDVTLYINSLVDRTLCPPGKLVIMAIAPNMRQWPSPQDPSYRSEAYQALKQQEAERMLDQIEQHYPGFRQHVRTLIVGTPTTIERYLLKNGGAVGGPKNAIGQEMLKRLHARSEWKNLYYCGESTVMATGAPATVVSGVGAPNVVLRDLHKAEYDARAFPRQYVHFVDLPHNLLPYRTGEMLSEANAPRAAAQCQWCETPACVAGCPAGIDIPGFLRRMEAQNYIGAARLLRERNPFAEVCGHTCAADPPCEANCYRKSFARTSVRIAALQRWACEAAGDAGWLQPDGAERNWRIAVLGGGPAGLSCAYYLALTGCNVDVLDKDDQPDDRLRQAYAEADLPRAAVERDLKGILKGNVHLTGGSEIGGALDIKELLGAYDAALRGGERGRVPTVGCGHPAGCGRSVYPAGGWPTGSVCRRGFRQAGPKHSRGSSRWSARRGGDWPVSACPAQTEGRRHRMTASVLLLIHVMPRRGAGHMAKAHDQLRTLSAAGRPGHRTHPPVSG